MTVDREELSEPLWAGQCVVTRATRQPNGRWSIEFDIDVRVHIDERTVLVKRRVSVQSTEQRGRKARSPRERPSND